MTTIEQVRDWVGTIDPADDMAILDVLDRVDSNPHRAAYVILSRRRADIASGAIKWAVADDYSEDNTATLAAIDADLARLALILGLPDPATPVMTAAPIVSRRPQR